jgi:hypothetical protein
MPTLESGIDIAPGINVDPHSLLKSSHQNFNSFLHQSRHCGHFFSYFFSKNNKRTLTFILDYRLKGLILRFFLKWNNAEWSKSGSIFTKKQLFHE